MRKKTYQMNLQLHMAMIYFGAGIYAWRPFNRNSGHNQKLGLQIKKYAEESIRESKNISGNSANHTFMDDEEFMKLLQSMF